MLKTRRGTAKLWCAWSRAPLTFLAAASFGLTSCAIDPLANVGRLASGGTTQFAHTLEKLPSGKNRLTVTAVPGPGQSEEFVDQQAAGFAYQVAGSTCPKGYDFFADDPLRTKSKSAARYQQTYVFQCR